MNLRVLCRTCGGHGVTFRWPKMRHGPMPPWVDPEEFGCTGCDGSGVVGYDDYYLTPDEAPYQERVGAGWEE